MASSGPTVLIDGLPVAVGTAAKVIAIVREFNACGFRDSFGRLVTLHVFSGWRSEVLQTRIFLDRYVRSWDVNGRHVYDTRWWNGALWYRISGAGTVMQPSPTAPHTRGVAIDFRDSGADAGVSRAGNERAAALVRIAAKHRLPMVGYRFGEPWHGENDDEDCWTPPAGGLPATVEGDTADTKEDDMQENSSYSRTQNLDGPQEWPIELAEGRHAFVELGAGQHEDGLIVLTLAFEGVAPDETAANVRAVFEEKQADGSWQAKSYAPHIPVNGRGQYTIGYSLGGTKPQRGRVLVNNVRNGIALGQVAYYKRYAN